MSKVKIIISIVIVAICLAAGAAGGIALFVAKSLTPVEPEGPEVRVTIPRGTSTANIAELLEQKGIIRNHTVFYLYLRYHQQGSRFQAGEYAFEPGMTLTEIIEKLNRGDTVKEPTVRLSIPEGYTVKQMAEAVGQQKLGSAESFLALASQTDGHESVWVRLIPTDKPLLFALEGYLFPETYELKVGSSEKDVIARMLAELDMKLRTLPEGWQGQLDVLGISFHDVMTIASLIEREVIVDMERKIVAGVIYNRIKKGMNLEIDATVQYALGEQKERLLYEDLKVDSPYNTYKNPGLPPGPIASPGIKSIEAALYPEETTYLFYVTKKDGSNEHLFAETFEQHKRNKAESEKK